MPPPMPDYKPDRCPYCEQPLTSRYGVYFPRKKADLLDFLEPLQEGATTETLCWVFYPDKPKRAAARTVAVHINQINDMLLSTDYKIVNVEPCQKLGGKYKLVNNG